MIKIKIFYLIAFCTVISLYGCSGQQIKAPVYLGEMDNFNINEKIEILNALNDLNKNFNNSIFTIKKNKSSKIFFQLSEKTKKSANGNLAGTAMNLISSCKITIFSVSWKDKIVKSVIWHEVGHCFGLEHSENPDDIMYLSVKPFEKYTKESVNTFLEDLKKNLK